MRMTQALPSTGGIVTVGNALPATTGTVTTYRVRRTCAGAADEMDDVAFEPGRPAATKVLRPRARRTRADIQQDKSPRIRASETRKVRYRGRETYCGDVPMTRLHYKLVAGDSLLECDFVIVTDATEDDLIDVQSQPEPLAIYVNGRKRKWTPDYLIRRHGFGAELVEVKNLSWLRPSDPVKAAGRRAWLEACAASARARGFAFRLLTEQEIRVEPRLSNAYLMHRHLGPFVDQGLLTTSIMALASLPKQATVADLGRAIENPLGALEMAIRLDRRGYIRLDRSAMFSPHSKFVINNSVLREPK